MNEHNYKLTAKIQHFYDYLVDASSRAAESAVSSYDSSKNVQNAIIMEAYTAMAIEYRDIFKDFVYTGETNE